MNWRWVRSAPKVALVFAVLVGSTVAFGFWWFVLRTPKSTARNKPASVEDIGKKLAQVEEKWARLLLVDNDLYELDSGAVIFSNWLNEGMPLKLFYDRESKRFIAQYPNGFVSYDFGGRAQAKLLRNPKAAFSDDYKWAVYAKDKDIWRTEMDWKGLKFVNEKKITSIGQFKELYFADNIFVGTEKTLVVRIMPNVLRVNLETGDVKPTRVPLLDIGKRKSADSKTVVGVQNGQFYSYDVDSDEAKTIPIGRGAIDDWQWLGNDRCAAIAAAKEVILYDRKTHRLDVITALPSQCLKIGEPSPDGRFVFCAGRNNFVLVDLEKKTATPVGGGAGIRWVSNDTFAFSRELPDSDLRGTWLQTVGEGERRVSPDPYLVSKAGGELMLVNPAGVVVFVTKQGLSKMKPDGSGAAQLFPRPTPPSLVLSIDDWKTN